MTLTSLPANITSDQVTTTDLKPLPPTHSKK
jgi:hypothetical protein